MVKDKNQNFEDLHQLWGSYHRSDDIATPKYDDFPSSYDSTTATPRSLQEKVLDIWPMD